MFFRKISWIHCLAIVAGCATEGGDDAPTGEDFRDGAYHYVLGYDDESGMQIRGGAHQVVSFDDNGKTEAINSANFPNRLHPDFTATSAYRDFDASLTAGETTWDVFASTWWPQSKNGTAWRWQPGASQDYANLGDTDRLSPMEKYDLTFNPGQTQQVAAVNHCQYSDWVKNKDACKKIAHPASTVAGPATKWELENQGQYQQYEPDNWWGHCNGWASYATSEPLGYPKRDVRVRIDGSKVTECTAGESGCVLWRMADIEALMTELYFSDQATFTGTRCNTSPDEIERDAEGRPTEPACRDLNPGSFHVAIVGMLGKGARNMVTGDTTGKPAFVIDHNYDHEIWNFPIVKYEMLEQADVTEAQASELVGKNGSDYSWNASATKFKRVKLAYWMVSDSVGPTQLLKRADTRAIDPVRVELNYVLELNDGNRILGGEWIDDPVVQWGENSKELHPDFAWMALDPQGFGESDDDLGGDDDNPHIAYSKARALLQCANDPSSCAPEGGGGGGGGVTTVLDLTGEADQGETLSFDTGVVAAGTYTVRMSHDPEHAGGDADLYVRAGSAPTTTTYDCRPYSDGSDEECVVNLAAEGTIFIGVRGYAAGSNAFRLVVETDGDEPAPPAWEGMNEAGSVAKNEEDRFATPQLAAGTYKFSITGNGDADLYVRRGTAPSATQFDCRPYSSGSAEQCSVTLADPAIVHVMVRGYANSSTYTLVGNRQ